jgi:hypothetical protein
MYKITTNIKLQFGGCNVEVQDKYLPDKEDRELFLLNRIAEYKKQVYGGVLECKMAEANGEKRSIIQTEDMMKQIIANIDVLTEELDNLE